MSIPKPGECYPTNQPPQGEPQPLTPEPVSMSQIAGRLECGHHKSLADGGECGYCKLTRQLAELKREHDIIQEQFHATDDALCKIGDLALQVSDHFNEDGSLKGDGKWRLNEIAKCCWAIVEAEKPVAAAHTMAREKPSLRSQLAEARQEVARLKEQLDAAECSHDDEESAHQETLQMLTAAQAAQKAAEVLDRSKRTTDNKVAPQ